VVYGLGAVKGVGEGPVAAIIEAREKSGDFKDLFDFCKRVGSKKINKRVLEALVASGALDDLVPNKERSVLYSAIPDAVQSADQSERNSDAGMMDLFGEIAATAYDSASLELAYERHITTRSLTLKQRLKGEKDTLGLYVTGHPIDSYDHELGRFLRCRLDQLMAKKDKQWIAGLQVNGSITLDDGAVTALLVDGTSLLPIGVTDTTDNFERGEAVHCMNLKGEEIALGLINYSATETRKILGSTSSEIKPILGYVDEVELINRKNLVLLNQ
jgi:DNA polymerase III alpha subunit